MAENLRCPFVPSPCVESHCMGWRDNHCFIDDVFPNSNSESGLLSRFKNILGTRQMTESATSVKAESHSDTVAPQKRQPDQPILLSLDLGTAYSKAAYRILDNPIPINFLGMNSY